MGEWTPTAGVVRRRSSPPASTDDRSLAALSVLPGLAARQRDRRRAGVAALLGDRAEWQVEWKWDGIRAQLVMRGGAVLPLVARRGADHRPLPGDRRRRRAAARRHRARRRGARLPRRSAAAVLGAAAAHRPRSARSRGTARDVPVVFMAYDLLEHDGARHPRARRWPSAARASRRSSAAAGVAAEPPPAAGAPLLPFEDDAGRPRGDDARVAAPVDGDAGTSSRALRAESRARGVEGLMLKRLDVALRRRPQARRLVEVEDRPAHHRRRADLRAAGLAAGAPACSPTTRSACGTAASWCRSPRPTRA